MYESYNIWWLMLIEPKTKFKLDKNYFYYQLVLVILITSVS